MVALQARAQEDLNAGISSWPLVDIIDVAGGALHGMGLFNSFCEKHRLFEFLTTEFVDGLVRHLKVPPPPPLSFSPLFSLLTFLFNVHQAIWPVKIESDPKV
jgi:hypothetical protein